MKYYFFIYILIILVAGCVDENITNISENMEITSSYSLPVGQAEYDINEYLDGLKESIFPWPDSLYYNDTLYPNYLEYVEEFDIKEFDFSRLGENLDKIESIMLRIIIDNGYPTKAISQVYFTDMAMSYLIDSVFSTGPHVIEPAKIDDNGRVVEPYHEFFDVYMSQQFIDNMADIRHVNIFSRVFTSRNDILHTKLYSDYRLKVHIGIRVGLRYNIEDLQE
jgi:hypothetical protein